VTTYAHGPDVAHSAASRQLHDLQTLQAWFLQHYGVVIGEARK